MLNRLISTKFHIPVWRQDWVSRPRLVESLIAGLQEGRKLFLISAPAGYGKTTVVTEWLHEIDTGGVGGRVAWLTLDDGDNDPVRYFNYWIAALQRVEPTIGQSAQSLLGMTQLPPLEAIMDELINDLAVLEDPLISVLDDNHSISNPDIHEAMEYFIDYQPRQLKLVITTRSDPPYSLSRLRVRQQLTEIRASDLRFNPQEMGDFFNESMQLELDTQAIETLGTRTEGWAAGMQLAALVLQNLPDKQGFLADFSGSHRYVIDYLVDEVLNHQPPEIREFLSRTALLKRFNADLCRAVTGIPDSEAILAKLERANLFIVPLDDRRGWYRYHHLFADVLHTWVSAETEVEVLTAAARWFENDGRLTEAIPYWLSIHEVKEASRLISSLATDLLRYGEVQTLLGWINSLPDTSVDRDPDMLTLQAIALLLTGQIELAQVRAEMASAAFSDHPQQTGQGKLQAVQAWFGMTSGDSRTGEFAQAALDHLAADDQFFRVLALIALGTDYGLKINLPESVKVFREVYQLGRQIDHPFISLVAMENLVFNLLEMGQLREAEAMCRSAMDYYQDSLGRYLPVLSIIYTSMAIISYEKGEFDEARKFAKESIASARRLFSTEILGGDGEAILATIAFERGNPDQAFDLLNTTAEAARQRNVMMVTFKMAIIELDLYLLSGNLAEVETRLKSLDSMKPADLPKAVRIIDHLHSRYLKASGQFDRALTILDELERICRQDAYYRRLMSVQVTQALIYQQQGKQNDAQTTFESALRMAAPEGYRAMFIPHETRPTRSLLQSSRHVSPDFVDSILNLAEMAPEEPQPAAALLVDPLTDQELTVVGLLAEGKSNQEIADELVISVGTAKWHVHNILGKLDVSNRSQAAARAHELKLL